MTRDSSADTPREQRPCSDCRGEMKLIHAGQFATIYACSTCGSTLTVPPPQLPERSPDRPIQELTPGQAPDQSDVVRKPRSSARDY